MRRRKGIIRVQNDVGRPARPGPFGVTYLALLAVGALVSAVVYWGIAVGQGLDPLPRTFDTRQGPARLETLRTSLTVVAGAAAIAGLYVGYRRQRNDEANYTREQDKVFTERFATTAQLLNGELAGTRLMGLDSLVRLADDSDRDRDACIHQLCSYLRRPIALKEGRSSLDSANDRSFWADFDEWDVRRAGANLLASRLRPDTINYWAGEVDLRGAVLVGVDFSECFFASKADFQGAIFVDDYAFIRTRFASEARWGGAIFMSGLQAESMIFSEGAMLFDDVTILGDMTLFWDFDARISLRDSIIDGDLLIEPNIRYTRGLARIMSTTRKIDLRGANLQGGARLPMQALDVRGTDLRTTKWLVMLDVAQYYAWPDPRGLVQDENTYLPEYKVEEG